MWDKYLEVCYGWLNLTDGEDIDFVYLKFNGFQSLIELRERAEWVRMREMLPYMMSPAIDKKGFEILSKRLSEPFYWEEKKKEVSKVTPEMIEWMKKQFE